MKPNQIFPVLLGIVWVAHGAVVPVDKAGAVEKVDVRQCDNFGLERCGFSCVAHALEYIGCKRDDVKCLCEHQNELTQHAGECVVKQCGRGQAKSLLEHAKQHCKEYYYCTAIPKTTQIVGLGAQTFTFPMKALAAPTIFPIGEIH